ncbi:MAG: type II toxin-antitoxin system ParD family antitoxin [Gammaproteobacteria bacterium]|nr:MAG: type II toxin-antitoxin system ParD family antitoxin [Gammaproteobacteria bacterium]
MGRTTSVTLGDSLNRFVDNMIEGGRYSSTTEVVRAGLRLLEKAEQEIWLANYLREGVESGLSDKTPEQIAEKVRKQHDVV